MWCGECRLLVIWGKLTSPRWKRLEDRGVMILSISLSFLDDLYSTYFSYLTLAIFCIVWTCTHFEHSELFAMVT
jgi:hypothetical protein